MQTRPTVTDITTHPGLGAGGCMSPERAAALRSRFAPAPEVMEARIGLPLSAQPWARDALLARGWRCLSSGFYVRDLADRPRTFTEALGAAYLAWLAEHPADWHRVLAWAPNGTRTISGGPLGFPVSCAALPPAELAALAGALLVAHTEHRAGRRPYGKRCPVGMSLEALASTCLPRDPDTRTEHPIAPAYLATYGTAAE